MYILGISAFYHDSAACLVKDGDIIAAAQEERFTRKKHDPGFPANAIDYCLKEAGISVNDLNYVGLYDKPFIKFERILYTTFSYAPLGIRTFIKAMPGWLKQKLFTRKVIQDELGYEGDILFTEHHEAHAASAYFPSPFEDSAILTVDGVGEWTTTSYGIGEGNNIEIISEIRFPHSVGLLYSAFTYYTGFKVNSGEYKVMGLAPYGKPIYAKLIFDNLIDLKEDGSFRLNMRYFNYCAGLTMTNGRFNRLFGGPPRRPESKLTQRDMDIASSIQFVTEEIMLRMANHAHKETGKKNLCLAGGVALNCVANGKILREGHFENIWIQPAAGDAGGALGAALFIWHQYLDNKKELNCKKLDTAEIDMDGSDLQHGSYLGPSFHDNEIESFLIANNIPFNRFAKEDIPKKVSELIAQENVIGWFQGRMEFGPRALGARSIIGDARSKEMQSTMNLKIKFRESFRPFAPSVLKEHVSDFFEIDRESPYMLLVAAVKRDKRIDISDNDELTGIDKLSIARSEIPAVTHVDYSARIQTINRDVNPLFYDTINEFYKETGCPVIINTSFNVRGEPVVCTPAEAFRCFMRTNMDYLIMGSYLLDKKEQGQIDNDTDWKNEFTLD